MLISRWQAPLKPTPQQIKILLAMEGLDSFEENMPVSTKIKDHRHPFGEVRFVVSGELLFNVSGNQVLLRAGDRIEVPANTRHSHGVHGNEACLCICAHRII